MLKIRRAAAAFLLAGSLGSCGRESSVPEMSVNASVVTAQRILDQRVETLEDTLGFFATTDLIPHPTGYVVVDGGNDRLVIVDHDLEPTHVIAASGSGPGELEAPLRADWTDEEIAVLELTNGRISFFGLDGSFRDVLTLPRGFSDLAMEPSGSVLVAPGSPEAFLSRFGRDGSQRSFGRRPVPRQEHPDYPGGLDRLDKVAIAEGGIVLVLDNTSGQLFAFDPAGRLLRTAMLPREIVSTIRERQARWDAMFARQGQRVIGDGLVKTMKAQRDGTVLLLLSASPYFGMVVHPENLEATFLAVPDRPGPWEPLLNAVGGVVDEDEIVVLHGHGLTRFRLSETP